jgi:hypothetical protein
MSTTQQIQELYIAKIKELQATLKETTTINLKLMEDLKEAKEQEDYSQQYIDELENQVEDLDAEVDEKDDEIAELKKRNEELEDELDETRTELEEETASKGYIFEEEVPEVVEWNSEIDWDNKTLPPCWWSLLSEIHRNIVEESAREIPEVYGNYVNRDLHFEVQFEDPNFQTNQKFSTERDLFPEDFKQNAWSGLGEHQQTCDFLISRTWDWDDVNQEFFKKYGAKDAREPYYCRMD